MVPGIWRRKRLLHAIEQYQTEQRIQRISGVNSVPLTAPDADYVLEENFVRGQQAIPGSRLMVTK